MRHLLLLSLLLVACSSSSEAPSSDGPASNGPAGGSEQNGGTTDAGGGNQPPPCSGKAGTFSDVAFDSGGETRHYWMHVPASYDCTKPAAMLVDFHGTSGGSETDTVEESYATPDLIAAADDGQFIAVRPRSRFKKTEATNIYQWDINAGDIPKNKTFVTELVADLRGKYNVDAQRLYASGFSNGPNMALQFIADEPSLFRGYGVIAGGLHAPLKRTQKFGADAPRIYATTGFRDYMLTTTASLMSFLESHDYPKETALFRREADTGHEVYGWHFREAFAWMDRGSRPAAGTLAAGWTKEQAPDESFIEASPTFDSGGSLVVVGAQGGIYARAANATWSKRAAVSIAPLTDVCVTPNGTWFAAGAGSVAKSNDGTSWSILPALPEFGVMGFGRTYATTVGCADARITVGGTGSTATSIDDGKTWTAASAANFGYGASVAAIRRNGSKWLALGYYDYVGTSSDGTTFDAASIAGDTQWWNDGVIGDGFIVAVGEGGALMRSTDDGATFAPVTAPTRQDLYAVSARGSRVVAVGAHGAVITSSDGGVTWTDRSTGLDGYLGAVRFLSESSILVLGEHGTALRRDL